MRTVLLVVLFIACTDANAQLFSKEAFKAANGKWSLGLSGGVVGLPDDASQGAVGFNLTIKGFYLDIMGWPSSHDNDVRVDKWREKTCNTAHFGYQIPVLKAFRLIPVVGYFRVGHTTTDGSDWTIRNGNIHNATSISSDVDGFDYGGIAVFNINRINIYGAYTRHCLYGAIAYQF